MTEVAIREAPGNDSIVARAASGDQAAFAHLVTEHHASMARVAYAITGEAESAADAVQVAWAAAWQRLRSLRDPSTVGPWLIAIAANEARQVLRRQRRRPVLDISSVAEPTGGSDPAEVSTIDLARALRALNPDDRMLLALRFTAGMDSNEIAGRLGMSASGVRSRLSRLIERLRTEIENV